MRNPGLLLCSFGLSHRISSPRYGRFRRGANLTPRQVGRAAPVFLPRRRRLLAILSLASSLRHGRLIPPPRPPPPRRPRRRSVRVPRSRCGGSSRVSTPALSLRSFPLDPIGRVPCWPFPQFHSCRSWF
jgi:hypothetical protein